MKFALAMIAVLCLFSSAAQASHKHHRHFGHHLVAHGHHHFGGHHRSFHREVAIAGLNLVTVETKAGPITVAANLADKFVGFINALPYTPRHVSCFARGGHVAHSRHYAGAACDIDQTGWGRTAGPMHHITALAAQFGLRDGCSFSDCGHVDDGQVLSGHTYASLRRGHRYGG